MLLINSVSQLSKFIQFPENCRLRLPVGLVIFAIGPVGYSAVRACTEKKPIIPTSTKRQISPCDL